jgi:hypothetical protein
VGYNRERHETRFSLLFAFFFLILSNQVRVLQYRSVAFVTYVSELNAQFAKEAMACQSLDNDEILNVRWATEDPNPVSKVAEKRRLEEMGQEAIKARMDPRIVDAMRAVRALEEGHEVDADDVQGHELEDEAAEPHSKRRRLAVENGDAVMESSEDASPTPPTALDVSAPSTDLNPPGLLSADALEGLKYFSEIRKRHGAPVAPLRRAPVPTSGNGLGLADYGSDDDG